MGVMIDTLLLVCNAYALNGKSFKADCLFYMVLELQNLKRLPLLMWWKLKIIDQMFALWFLSWSHCYDEYLLITIIRKLTVFNALYEGSMPDFCLLVVQERSSKINDKFLTEFLGFLCFIIWLIVDIVSLIVKLLVEVKELSSS